MNSNKLHSCDVMVSLSARIKGESCLCSLPGMEFGANPLNFTEPPFSIYKMGIIKFSV